MYRTSLFRFIAPLLVVLPAAFTAPPLPDFTPWEGSKLEGTRDNPLPYQVEQIYQKITWKEPLAMSPVPGAPGQYVVVEQPGHHWIVGADQTKRNLMLHVRGRTLNALFHPDFPKKPIVYLRYSSAATNRLVQYTVSSKPPYVADPKSAKEIITWPSRGHRGGDLLFGTDGYMYLTAGDGQLWGDPDNTAQDTTTLQASILRIDVETPTNGKLYAVPKDNPFVGVDGIRPEIWAYGVRNPWRFTLRPGTNELWIGDNGDETWEMVLRTSKGVNHGWSRFEGSHIFRPNNPLKGPVQTHTPPAVEHSHKEMRSVIGGRWYRGKAFPELRGHYVYGDHVTGRLWSFTLKEDKPTTPRRIARVGGQVVSFCEDPDGELLIVTLDKGIYKMKRAPANNAQPVPKKLSETGLFTAIGEHKTAPGLLPYDVNLPVYWDGATAERFVGVAQGKPIQVRHAHRRASLLPPLRSRIGLDRWTLHPGSLVMQTLSMPGADGKPRRIETQISLNDAEEWRFLTYKWNAEQTDAELVPEGGLETEVLVKDKKQRWRFAGRGECISCHTHVNGFVPGINLAQLNLTKDYAPLGGGNMNQIAMWRDLGFLPKGYRPPGKDVTMPKPLDESASIEDRARAYLHVNCGHCHRETGLGGRAQFHTLGWLTNEGTGMINGKPLVGLPGADPDKARLIAPGAPEHSEIHRRMIARLGGRMPLFGATQVDKEGAELIRKWIESLKK